MHNRWQAEDFPSHTNIKTTTTVGEADNNCQILMENNAKEISDKIIVGNSSDSICCCCFKCSPFGMRMAKVVLLMILLFILIAFFVWALPLLRLVYWNSRHFSQTGLRLLEANPLITMREQRDLVEKVEKDTGIHIINMKSLKLFGEELQEILNDFSILYQLRNVMQERRIGEKLLPIIQGMIENFYKKVLIRPSLITRSVHQTYKTKDVNLLPNHWKDSPDMWSRYRNLYVNSYLGDKIDPELEKEVSINYANNIWIDEEMDQYVQSEDWKSVSRFNQHFYESFFKFIPMKIQKIDTIRYCWLSKIGGIYSDLDIRPRKDIEELLRYLELYHIVQPLVARNSEKDSSLKERFHKMVNYLKDSMEIGSSASIFEQEWEILGKEMDNISKLKPRFSAAVPKTYPFGISNDFLIGAKDSEFFQFVVQRSVAEFSRWKFMSYIPIARYAYVMLTGGPLFLSECYRQFTWEKAKKCK